MSENKKGGFNIPREVKIGLTVVMALAMLYFGVNYLKGINLFTPTNYYYVQLDRVDNIVPTTHVMVNGFQVGQVDEILFDYDKMDKITLRITVDKDLRLPQGTVAEVYDTGLLGDKALQLKPGNSQTLCVRGDTLPCTTAPGMFTDIVDRVVPAIQELMPKIDSLIVSVNGIVDPENSRNITAILSNINQVTADLKHTTKSLNGFLDNDLPALKNDISGALQKIDGIASAVDPQKVNNLMTSINSTLGNLKTTTDKFNSKDNSIGLLLNDKGVYNNLDSTIVSANKLLIDIKANPKRYINVTVFGGKNK